MTTTREQFEAQPTLNQALNEWSPDDGWLSAGQIALASTVHALVDHFDRLDGQYQMAIANALAAVAEETSASEEYVRAAIGADRCSTPTKRGRDHGR